MSEQVQYCSACGAVLDDEGICTRLTCFRRRLQLLLKKRREEADQAKTEEATAPTNETAEGTTTEGGDTSAGTN